MLCPRTFCLAKLWESIFNMCDVEGFWPSTSPIAFWTSLRLSPASQRHFVSTLSKFATSTAYGSCFPKTPRSSERRTWNDGRPRLYWQENPCSGPTTTAIFLPCYVGSSWLSDDRRAAVQLTWALSRGHSSGVRRRDSPSHDRALPHCQSEPYRSEMVLP